MITDTARARTRVLASPQAPRTTPKEVSTILPRSLVAATVAVLLVFPVSSRADVISTSEALALEDESRARAVVDEYLARHEVAAELTALGVDPELARLRAEALSSAEVLELAGRIEEAPAGGLGVLGVLGLTLLVLIFLELVGAIDIFKKL